MICAFFASFKGFCNDSTIYKANIIFDLTSDFFSCKRNILLPLVKNDVKIEQNAGTALIITIADSLVSLTANENVVTFKLVSVDSGLIIFESKKRAFANSISICNRERFLYRLEIDLETSYLVLRYDMSLIHKNDMTVFVGKLSQ